MRRRIGLRAALPPLASLVLLAGCVAGEAQVFFITKNQIPTAASTGSGVVCQVKADTNQDLRRERGLYDVTDPPRQGYLFFPVVENQLPITKKGKEPERNRLVMKSFRIKLDLSRVPGGAAGVPAGELEFQRRTSSAVIKPGGSAAFIVPILSGALGARLERRIPARGRISIDVEVVGVASHNGSEVRTPPFFYPLELCRGCLVTILDSCPSPGTKVTSNVCGLAQDGPVSCCTPAPKPGATQSEPICLATNSAGTTP